MSGKNLANYKLSRELAGGKKSAKNIVIVESPFYAFFNYDQWNYAYSCAYYAALVKQHGHSAYIYDADKYFGKDILTKSRLTMVNRQKMAEENIQNADHSIWQHYRKVLLDLKPDVVLLSTWTFKLASIDKCIEITKEILPHARIAVGGYHATAMPESYIPATPGGLRFYRPRRTGIAGVAG